MEADHPTASWEALHDGSVFYRRHQVYSISGKLPDLGDFVIAGCRYGGPIGMSQYSRHTYVAADMCLNYYLALMRDTTKLVALGRATPAFSKAQIQIYSPAGEGLLLFSVVICLCSAHMLRG